MRRACPLHTLLLAPQILSLAAPDGADVRTFAAYLKGCILPMFARGSVDIKDLQAGLTLNLNLNSSAPCPCSRAAPWTSWTCRRA